MIFFLSGTLTVKFREGTLRFFYNSIYFDTKCLKKQIEQIIIMNTDL